jgi:protein SCO1/2
MEDRLISREEAQALTGLVTLFVVTAAWWALALWPVQDSPVWLQRTRYVCFGVSESGLPDTGGWIGLIAGPAGMLAILFAGWNRALRTLVQRARTSRAYAMLFSALLLGCAVMVTGAAVRVQQVRAVGSWDDVGTRASPRDYPRLDRTAPRLALTAQSGDIIDLATLRGRPVILTFAYAHCATICPLVVARALRAQATLHAGGDSAVVVVVTLDPWRDTPARLASIAAGWQLPQRDAHVLSGAVSDVEKVLDAWTIPRTRDDRTGAVTHPSVTYIIDAEGRVAFITGDGSEAIVALVRRL